MPAPGKIKLIKFPPPWQEKTSNARGMLTKPSDQIVYCHVTDVKMLKKFSLLNNDTIGLSLPQISGIYL